MLLRDAYMSTAVVSTTTTKYQRLTTRLTRSRRGFLRRAGAGVGPVAVVGLPPGVG